MVWVYVIVILCAIVYMVSVIGDYNSYLKDEQPRIERTETRAEKIGQAADGEALLRDQAVARVEEANSLLSELKNSLASAKQETQNEQQREQDLEMDMYKSEFKRNKKKS